MSHELNSQISLSQRLIDNYNNIIRTLTSNQEKINVAFKYLQFNIKQVLDDLAIYLIFQDLVNQFISDCEILRDFLDNLENAISFATDNILDNKKKEQNAIPKFKNQLSYYKFLGTQVTFTDTKIAEEVCPIIEKHYICTEKLKFDDGCMEQLLNKTKLELLTGPIFKLPTKKPIIEQISQELVFILPQQIEEIFAQCKTDQQYIEINRSVLVTIPDECIIEINKTRFANNLNVEEVQPIILLEKIHRFGCTSHCHAMDEILSTQIDVSKETKWTNSNYTRTTSNERVTGFPEKQQVEQDPNLVDWLEKLRISEEAKTKVLTHGYKLCELLNDVTKNKIGKLGLDRGSSLQI
ncbi:hypothetical protein ABEB36_010022 [Hypothenemus hampei]|uniref:Uncharacterized protein n=1 Tax=Hypothenemus hampei TaxID=57062 RepID=A0ABD1EKE1_HYPHA